MYVISSRIKTKQTADNQQTKKQERIKAANRE